MGPLGSWIDELKAWVDGFEPGTLDGEQAVALVAVAAEGERLFAAVKLKAMGRVAATGAWQAGGARSAADWVARQTKTERGRAAAALETAGRLADCPAVDREVSAGRLSESQAHLIVDAVAVRADAEAGLIEYAHGHSVRQLAEECRRVKTTADDVADANERLHASRAYRTWTGRDGAWCFSGRGTPEDGAAFQAAVEAEAAKLNRAARADGRREPFEALAFDALVKLVTEDRGAGDGGPATRPRASVVVHVDYEALMRGAVEGCEICEIKGVGPIPVAVARAMLDDCVLYLLIKRGGAAYATTPGVRTIPKPTRMVVEARDRCCVVPGCDQTKGLEIHHVRWHAKRGDRTRENLVLICKRHHDLITYCRWGLVGSPGDYTLRPPGDWTPDPDPGPEVPYWSSPWAQSPDASPSPGPDP